MLEQGLGFSTITARMLDIYQEVISKDSLANHKKHHMGKDGSKIEPAKDKSNLDKGDLTQMLNPPVSELAALTHRIHVLELILAKFLILDGSQTSYVGYDLNGSHPHDVKRRDLLTSEMGDAKTIEAEFNALVSSVVKKQREASGELEHDDFKKEREELQRKHLEDAKRELAKAEAEIAKQEAQVIKIKAGSNLTPDRLKEIRDNDLAASAWMKEKEAKEKAKQAKEANEAGMARQRADAAAIDGQADIKAIVDVVDEEAAMLEMEDEE
jgi:hypothetical protein